MNQNRKNRQNGKGSPQRNDDNEKICPSWIENKRPTASTSKLLPAEEPDNDSSQNETKALAVVQDVKISLAQTKVALDDILSFCMTSKCNSSDLKLLKEQMKMVLDKMPNVPAQSDNMNEVPLGRKTSESGRIGKTASKTPLAAASSKRLNFADEVEKKSDSGTIEHIPSKRQIAPATSRRLPCRHTTYNAQYTKNRSRVNPNITEKSKVCPTAEESPVPIAGTSTTEKLFVNSSYNPSAESLNVATSNMKVKQFSSTIPPNSRNSIHGSQLLHAVKDKLIVKQNSRIENKTSNLMLQNLPAVDIKAPLVTQKLPNVEIVSDESMSNASKDSDNVKYEEINHETHKRLSKGNESKTLRDKPDTMRDPSTGSFAVDRRDEIPKRLPTIPEESEMVSKSKKPTTIHEELNIDRDAIPSLSTLQDIQIFLEKRCLQIRERLEKESQLEMGESLHLGTQLAKALKWQEEARKADNPSSDQTKKSERKRSSVSFSPLVPPPELRPNFTALSQHNTYASMKTHDKSFQIAEKEKRVLMSDKEIYCVESRNKSQQFSAPRLLKQDQEQQITPRLSSATVSNIESSVEQLKRPQKSQISPDNTFEIILMPQPSKSKRINEVAPPSKAPPIVEKPVQTFKELQPFSRKQRSYHTSSPSSELTKSTKEIIPRSTSKSRGLATNEVTKSSEEYSNDFTYSSGISSTNSSSNRNRKVSQSNMKNEVDCQCSSDEALAKEKATRNTSNSKLTGDNENKTTTNDFKYPSGTSRAYSSTNRNHKVCQSITKKEVECQCSFDEALPKEKATRNNSNSKLTGDNENKTTTNDLKSPSGTSRAYSSTNRNHKECQSITKKDVECQCSYCSSYQALPKEKAIPNKIDSKLTSNKETITTTNDFKYPSKTSNANSSPNRYRKVSQSSMKKEVESQYCTDQALPKEKETRNKNNSKLTSDKETITTTNDFKYPSKTSNANSSPNRYRKVSQSSLKKEGECPYSSHEALPEEKGTRNKSNSKLTGVKKNIETTKEDIKSTPVTQKTVRKSDTNLERVTRGRSFEKDPTRSNTATINNENNSESSERTKRDSKSNERKTSFDKSVKSSPIEYRTEDNSNENQTNIEKMKSSDKILSRESITEHSMYNVNDPDRRRKIKPPRNSTELDDLIKEAEERRKSIGQNQKVRISEAADDMEDTERRKPKWVDDIIKQFEVGEESDGETKTLSIVTDESSCSSRRTISSTRTLSTRSSTNSSTSNIDKTPRVPISTENDRKIVFEKTTDVQKTKKGKNTTQIHLLPTQQDSKIKSEDTEQTIRSTSNVKKDKKIDETKPTKNIKTPKKDKVILEKSKKDKVILDKPKKDTKLSSTDKRSKSPSPKKAQQSKFEKPAPCFQKQCATCNRSGVEQYCTDPIEQMPETSEESSSTHQQHIPRGQKRFMSRVQKYSTPIPTTSSSEMEPTSLSEGEVRLDCNCSTSIGELHLCHFARDIRKKGRYYNYKANPEKALEHNSCLVDVEIKKQFQHYDNWVSYYVNKNVINSPNASTSDNLSSIRSNSSVQN